MHHQRADQACPGDNVVLNIKGVDKNASRRSRDAMVYKKYTTLGQTCSLVEMHHQRADQACLGDNVVLNIKGVDKNDSRRSRDAMVYKKDTTLGQKCSLLRCPTSVRTRLAPVTTWC